MVELFLVDWLRRKALLQTDKAKVPDVVRAWKRFAAGCKGIEERLVAETLEAVDRWTPEFLSAIDDPNHEGPAKALVGAMLAAGVDITDHAATDAWVAGFNSRPEEERRKVLP